MRDMPLLIDWLSKNIPDSVVLVIAKDRHAKKPLAAALNFQDSNSLYGRYWGCLEEYDSLHFESCYYQGIEHCIEKKLKKFCAHVRSSSFKSRCRPWA